jgi:hypothetical protein
MPGGVQGRGERPARWQAVSPRACNVPRSPPRHPLGASQNARLARAAPGLPTLGARSAPQARMAETFGTFSPASPAALAKCPALLGPALASPALAAASPTRPTPPAVGRAGGAGSHGRLWAFPGGRGRRGDARRRRTDGANDAGPFSRLRRCAASRPDSSRALLTLPSPPPTPSASPRRRAVCPPGSGGIGPTNFGCQVCPAGTYGQSLLDSQPCAACGAGEVAAAGSSNCTACTGGSVPNAARDTCGKPLNAETARAVGSPGCDPSFRLLPNLAS